MNLSDYCSPLRCSPFHFPRDIPCIRPNILKNERVEANPTITAIVRLVDLNKCYTCCILTSLSAIDEVIRSIKYTTQSARLGVTT